LTYISEKILYDISEQIQTNRMILFLGSGSTRSCRRSDGSPGLSGQELSDEILKKLNNGQSPNFHVSLTKAAEFYASSHPDGRKSLDNFIKSRLTNLQPTLGHYLTTLFPWKAIITTNYNTVIEIAYEILNRESEENGKNSKNYSVYPIISDEGLASVPKNSSIIPLYKPHGSISYNINENNRLIVTSKDFFDSINLRPQLYKRLNLLVKQNSTLFIGYSMNDYTFKNIFYDLHNQLGVWQMRLYNVARKQNELIYKWSKKALDKDFNTSLVRTTFDGFMVRLVEYQKKRLSCSLKDRIIKIWPETLQRNKGYLFEEDLKKLKQL
jgi:hypothetical protein